MSDFTGQELACLLKRENRSIRCLYRLTISKCLDRKGLVLALRELYSFSINERLKIADNLPFTDDIWTSPEHVKHYLTGQCEFTYERIPFPGNTKIETLPWESPKYLEAKAWYDSLSKENQAKIDILVLSNCAWA